MAEQRGIPNLDGLVTLANRDGVDIKPTLLRVMTDLYVQKPRHTAEEEQHYVELALRLIDAVDAQTRAVVAGKLAAYATPPASVMRQLRRKDGGSEIAPVAPERRAGTAAVAELCDLFFSANAEERRLILINLKYASLSPVEPIAPAAAHSAIQRLETAALGHSGAAFAQELERTLGLPRELAQRLIEDETGEPVVVAARALGMSADVLQRILLCLNPAVSQSVLRVYELARLYEDIEPKAALRMIAIWRSKRQAAPKAPPVSQPASRRAAIPQPSAHQPQYWHVEERPALPARPQIRWEQIVPTRKAENE